MCPQFKSASRHLIHYNLVKTSLYRRSKTISTAIATDFLKIAILKLNLAIAGVVLALFPVIATILFLGKFDRF
jgi:hypothetical protein